MILNERINIIIRKNGFLRSYNRLLSEKYRRILNIKKKPIGIIKDRIDTENKLSSLIAKIIFKNYLIK